MASLLDALATGAKNRVATTAKDAKESVMSQFDPRKSIYGLGLGVGPLIRQTVAEYKKQQGKSTEKEAKKTAKDVVDIKTMTATSKNSLNKMNVQLRAMNNILGDIRKINIAQLQAMKVGANIKDTSFNRSSVIVTNDIQDKQASAASTNADAIASAIKKALMGAGIVAGAGYAYQNKDKIEGFVDDFLRGAKLPAKEELSKDLQEKLAAKGGDIADFIASQVWSGTKALGIAIGRKIATGAENDIGKLLGFEQDKKTKEWSYTGKSDPRDFANDAAPLVGGALGVGGLALLAKKYPVLKMLGLTGFMGKTAAGSLGALGGYAASQESPGLAAAGSIALPAAAMYFLSKGKVKPSAGAADAIPQATGSATGSPWLANLFKKAPPVATPEIGSAVKLSDYGTVGAQAQARRLAMERAAEQQASTLSKTQATIGGAISKASDLGKEAGGMIAKNSGKIFGALNVAMSLPGIYEDIQNGDYAAAAITATGVAASLAATGLTGGLGFGVSMGIGVGSSLLADQFRTKTPNVAATNINNSNDTSAGRDNNITPNSMPAGSSNTTQQGDLSFVPKDVLADKAFMAEVQRVADKHGISVSDLLSVMKAENSTFDPSRKNPNSSATGLIQFMDKTAKWLGTSTTELAGMSRAGQMKWVDKYFDKVGLPHGATKGQIYASIFKPAALKNKDFVMYSKGSREYEANKGLDSDNKGSITLADLENRASNAQGRGNMSTTVSSATGFDTGNLKALGLDDQQIKNITGLQDSIREYQDLGNMMQGILQGNFAGMTVPSDGGGNRGAAPSGGNSNRTPPSVPPVSQYKEKHSFGQRQTWYTSGGTI